MVVARASGTLIASSLKQNTFLTLELHPAGGSPRYGRSPKGRVGEGGGRAELRHRNNNIAQNLFCFELDAMSVPEALATTILILLMFSIVLAHKWGPWSMGPRRPSGTPHRHPIGTLSTPWAPRRPARLLGDRS